MYKILNVLGAPDRNRLHVFQNNGDVNQLNINLEGCNTLNNLIDRDLAELTTVTLGGMEPKAIKLLPAHAILNSICDPDTNRRTLLQGIKLFEGLAIPIINRPENTLKTTRDQTYALLHNIEGLIVPKAIRITPTRLTDVPNLLAEENMTYPYIFRSTGEHGGGGMALIKDKTDLFKLEQFAFDGRAFYVIEFVDFQSDDKLYRKTRFIVIEGEVYFRHHVITDNWKIHASSRHDLMDDNLDLREEEKALVTKSTSDIATRCRKIYEVLGLDSFGIDCNIDEDGSMLVFEVNTCMNTTYGTTPNPKYDSYQYLQSSASTIRKAFNQMVKKKIETSLKLNP